jgi:hypothetical protein
MTQNELVKILDVLESKKHQGTGLHSLSLQTDIETQKLR